MSFDPQRLDYFPSGPGVYLMKDRQGGVLYVGKAKQLKSRLKQYFAAGRDTRPMIPHLVAEISHIDTIVVGTEKEALLLENTLIKKHRPKYNIILKDDKSYVSILVTTKHEWPMLKLVRYKGSPKEKGLYFGPYTSGFAARQTYELLTKLFPLRQCSDDELKRRTRPCILYSIKRCIAPCVGKCTKIEYNAFVDSTIKFLQGQNKDILNDLYAQMNKASNDLEFEKAAAFLRTIRQIEHVTQDEQLVCKASGKDRDVFALHQEGEEILLVKLQFRQGKLIGSVPFSFSSTPQEEEEIFSSFLLQHYREQGFLPEEILLPIPLKDEKILSEILDDSFHKKVKITSAKQGEKSALLSLAQDNAKALFIQQKDHRELAEKTLLDLQEKLCLNRYPQRIECYDTSHISGSNLVSCYITYVGGKRENKQTRYYHCKSLDKGDDYGALREVLTRRLIRGKEEEDLPDLILIDGGKGQLSTASCVLEELDIASVDIIALAKEEGRHDRGMRQERVFVLQQKDPVSFPEKSAVLFLLQKIRDETHDTVLRFHQKSRKKRVIKTALEEIPGIGPIKRKKLLKAFGSLKQILSATEEDLLGIEGISKKDVQALFAYRAKTS